MDGKEVLFRRLLLRVSARAPSRCFPQASDELADGPCRLYRLQLSFPTASRINLSSTPRLPTVKLRNLPAINNSGACASRETLGMTDMVLAYSTCTLRVMVKTRL